MHGCWQTVWKVSSLRTQACWQCHGTAPGMQTTPCNTSGSISCCICDALHWPISQQLLAIYMQVCCKVALCKAAHRGSLSRCAPTNCATLQALKENVSARQRQAREALRRQVPALLRRCLSFWHQATVLSSTWVAKAVAHSLLNRSFRSWLQHTKVSLPVKIEA